MLCDQLVAIKGCFPVALSARDENARMRLVTQPVDHDCATAGSDACCPTDAWVRQHVGPPFLRRRLLRMRPGAVFSAPRAFNMVATILTTSGRLASTRMKFGGMTA